MIPRLYSKTETAFNHYGICPLIDAISCVVTEERNGAFTLKMTYARDGRFVEELTCDRIILADPYDGATQAEPFRIISLSYDIKGNIVVDAQHISYQLNSVIIGKVTKSGRYPRLIIESIVSTNLKSGTCPFSFGSNIGVESNKTIKVKAPSSLKSIIGGMEGSFLDTFGGELKWERYTVRMLTARGEDSNVKIAYQKNLTGLKYDIDMSNVVTGVVAYYSSGDTYVESELRTRTHTYGYSHDIAVDASSSFDSVPTVAQLNTWASSYLNKQNGTPKISVDVDFVPFWQTEEYKDYYGLEHVKLCDTVEVIYPPLSLDVVAKVVKTEYNVLADRYDRITVSTQKEKLSDTIYALMRKK